MYIHSKVVINDRPHEVSSINLEIGENDNALNKFFRCSTLWGIYTVWNKIKVCCQWNQIQYLINTLISSAWDCNLLKQSWAPRGSTVLVAERIIEYYLRCMREFMNMQNLKYDYLALGIKFQVISSPRLEICPGFHVHWLVWRVCK